MTPAAILFGLFVTACMLGLAWLLHRRILHLDDAIVWLIVINVLLSLTIACSAVYRGH